MKEKQQPPLHRYTASQPASRGCTGGRKEEQYWEERATFDKKALSEQTTKKIRGSSRSHQMEPNVAFNLPLDSTMIPCGMLVPLQITGSQVESHALVVVHYKERTWT